MAMRLRRVRDLNGEWVLIAVCAALTEPKEGDVYLDDGQHHAIGMKYLYEEGEGVGDYGELMEREQGYRDAAAECKANVEALWATSLLQAFEGADRYPTEPAWQSESTSKARDGIHAILAGISGES